MSGPETIRLRSLGPPEVRVGERTRALPPKLLALLAYVTVAPPHGTVRRDTLLTMFWPELDASHARNALNQAVHQLRKKLGHDAVASRGDEELVVDGRIATDVERFEALLDAGDTEAALELYHGEFLQGFHLGGVPGFERWLDGVRVRIRRRAREGALAVAADAERDGHLRAAADRLRRAMELGPIDERVARRLIRIRIDSGDRSGALHEYRRLARRLEGRLGIEPSEETRALLAEAGLPVERPGQAPDVMSRSSVYRRIAGDLTERARDLLEAGRAENAAARELLAQATRLDATYAPAHAAHALAVGRWVDLFGGPWRELGAGLGTGRRAVELDPELPEAHLARASVLQSAGRLAEAGQSYRAVLELRPQESEAALQLGRVMCWAGDFVRALEWMERMSPSREGDPAAFHELAMIRHSLGEHDLGDELYGRALEARPDDRFAQSSQTYFSGVTGRSDRAVRLARAMVDGEPDGFVGLVGLAFNVLVAGDLEAAIPLYERCYALDPDSRNWGILRATRTALGFAHLEAGDPARGRKLLEAAERETRQALRAGCSFGALHYDLASIHAARGETEPALTWLERSCEAGWLQHELLRIDPVVAALRGSDRCEAVGAAMERNVREQRGRLG